RCDLAGFDDTPAPPCHPENKGLTHRHPGVPRISCCCIPQGTHSSYRGPRQTRFLFRFMTSFTECTGTSFTLQRELSERRSNRGNGLEKDGCPRATCAICSDGVTRGKAVGSCM